MKWNDHELASYGEIIEEALAIADPEERERFVAEFRRTGGPYALQNVGYCAGYYDRRIADRIFTIFGTAHPIFGTHEPTAEEAFEAGRQMGELAKERK